MCLIKQQTMKTYEGVEI